MNKLIKILLILFYIFFSSQLYAQSIVVRYLLWQKIGQKEVISINEKVKFAYSSEINPEYTYVKFHPSIKGDTYTLELVEKEYIADTIMEKIVLPQSIRVPFDGNPPIFETFSNNLAQRTITFDSIGHREKLFFGEVVNVVFKNLPIDSIFVSSIPDPEGFIVETRKRGELTKIFFKKRCEVYKVEHPSSTQIKIDKNLRYEQIIWTPSPDGLWEVRIGTIEQGCKSDALQRIKILRTKEYESNVPVFQYNFKKK